MPCSQKQINHQSTNWTKIKALHFWSLTGLLHTNAHTQWLWPLGRFNFFSLCSSRHKITVQHLSSRLLDFSIVSQSLPHPYHCVCGGAEAGETSFLPSSLMVIAVSKKDWSCNFIIFLTPRKDLKALAFKFWGFFPPSSPFLTLNIWTVQCSLLALQEASLEALRYEREHDQPLLLLKNAFSPWLFRHLS